MTDTASTVETIVDKNGKTRKKATHRRKGPECPTCHRAMPVTGAPDSPEKLEKAKKRLARLQAQVTIAEGAVPVKILTPEEREAKEKADLEAKLARKAERDAKKGAVAPTPA